jgi:hypothetical protein
MPPRLFRRHGVFLRQHYMPILHAFVMKELITQASDSDRLPRGASNSNITHGRHRGRAYGHPEENKTGMVSPGFVKVTSSCIVSTEYPDRPDFSKQHPHFYPTPRIDIRAWR